MSERVIKITMHYVGVSAPLPEIPGISPAVPGVPPLEFSTIAHLVPAVLGDWRQANRYVDARLIQPGLIERTMFGAGKLRGASPVNAGAIVLNNADGELDEILEYAYDGQYFYVDEVDPATFLLVQRLRQGFLEQPTYDEKTITFQCRDAAHALDVQLLDEKYAGTNALPAGIEGTPDDIGGTFKPSLIGTCFNVTPIQVNTSKKIYQLDGVRGLVSGYTLAVYDKRALVTEDSAGDYTDQADMEANAPTAGQYRVWPAGGCIRINFTPVGLLTCDTMNPGEDAPGFTSTGDSTLTQVLYTLTGIHPNGQLYEDDPNVGIYVHDDRTVLSAANDLLSSVGGFLVDGSPLNNAYSYGFSTAQLYEPGSPYFSSDLQPISLTEAELIPDSFRLVPPTESNRGLPVWRVNVQYARNWTVMTASDLAGIAADQVARWTREYLIATAEDAGVRTDWPAALELTVTTLLVDQTEAEAEAQRLLDLFSVPRQRFALRVPYAVIGDGVFTTYGSQRSATEFKPGFRVTLTLSRFGLEAGKTFVVTEVREDFEAGVIDLVIWG